MPKAKKKKKSPLVSAPAEVNRGMLLGPMRDIAPMTKTQESAFQAYSKNYNLVLSGAAGSGKTFIAIVMALREIVAEGFKRQLVIVRSVVPTRDMGFLPGTQADKESAYTATYESIVNDVFRDSSAWKKLVERGAIRFLTTSYIRGITLKNSIILVDEMQNCNFHECDSIITRVGTDSRVIFAGDYYQSDFDQARDKNGIIQFLKIIDRLKYFKHIQFNWEDCVRSGLVRDYLMTKEMIAKEEKAP